MISFASCHFSGLLDTADLLSPYTSLRFLPPSSSSPYSLTMTENQRQEHHKQSRYIHDQHRLQLKPYKHITRRDYSYTCYEPGLSGITFVYPNLNSLNEPRCHHQCTHYLQKSESPARELAEQHRHVQPYGIEEIYEISEPCRMILSESCRSLVADEVSRVHSRHRRVLEELNLNVEAMLMPSTVEENEDKVEINVVDGGEERPKVKATSSFSTSDGNMMSAVTGCDLDSGLSGSSITSYRKELSNSSIVSTSYTKFNCNDSNRESKVMTLWKKGWKGWKKLHAFTNPSKIYDEPRMTCETWDGLGRTTKMETTSKRRSSSQLMSEHQLQQHVYNHQQNLLLEPTVSSPSTHSVKSEDSWCSTSDHYHSSDDESEKSNMSAKSSCQLKNTLHKAKTLCDKWRSQNIRFNSTTVSFDSSSGQGRLSRWFSIRRGSTNQYDIDPSTSDNLTVVPMCNQSKQRPSSTPMQHSLVASTTVSMSRLPELEEESYSCGNGMSTSAATASIMQFQCMHERKQVLPTLPPSPSNLNAQELKRRHIIAAIVHSENSYVATLQRLVNEYKKPLEESLPPILSQTKIAILFHRLPEILQCHTLFGIALAESVRSWDKDEKLGDVFVASFSKAIVLDIYSDFINNFSMAMNLAKQESKRKTALADFFKVKQISAHDRLSFFGLMVKPVQRFPQFILFLQDLLKHTPHGHHDRMSLQLALTQLESLAEMLNERKREAEQFQAFKEMLRHVSGKLAHRPLSSSSSRYLIREDNVTQMEFNQSGMLTKSKRRRLLLLNDLVVCVSVTPRTIEDFSNNERLTLKWTCPVSDIEIQDTSTSPTLSRLLIAGLNKNGSLKSEKSCNMNENVQVSADNLCVEMNDLMQDYEVMSRINELATQLRGSYEGMTTTITKKILQSIQSSIQQKDEDMIWADSCCLQLTTKQGQMYTFRTDNPLVKKDWITELRLAQLALHPNNSPSWEVPEQEQRPSTKMPLFVSSQAVYHSKYRSEVRCGCYYTTQNPRATRRRNPQSYLWICMGDGVSSHITVFGQSTSTASLAISLKKVNTFDLVETRVAAVEFVKGVDKPINSRVADQVWMGTDSRKIIIYGAPEPEKQEEVGNYSVPSSVIQIKYHCGNVFVALGNGSLLMFQRNVDGDWLMDEPLTILLGTDPVTCLMPINNTIYAACGKKVWVLRGISGEAIKSFSVQHEHVGNVNLMAHSGVGLWVALKNSSTICLYHTETFKHLQDINIASNVLRVTKTSILDRISSPDICVDKLENNNLNPQISVSVTALMACKGLLWVGTNVGISLTIPLPRLEGVPIISGRVNISYHAHFGPITFFLAIQNNKPSMNILGSDHHVQYNSSDQSEIAHQQSHVHNRGSEEDDSVQREKVDYPANFNGLSTASTVSPASFSYNVDKVKQQLAGCSIALRRKRSKENECRGSKTLPRGYGGGGIYSTTTSGLLSTSSTSSQSSGENCDVYGLYGELMYIKDYENDINSGVDPIYESLRRSDPELAAIPNKVNTLDRRLKLKITRPRSLDLSNWSVDSHASSLYTSSGSEENLSKADKLSRDSSTVSRGMMNNSTCNFENSMPQNDINGEIIVMGDAEQRLNTMKKGTNTINRIRKVQQVDQQKRTILTLMGGRGYVNWRQLNGNTISPLTGEKHTKTCYSFDEPNSNDAHIVLWEMKL